MANETHDLSRIRKDYSTGIAKWTAQYRKVLKPAPPQSVAQLTRGQLAPFRGFGVLPPPEMYKNA